VAVILGSTSLDRFWADEIRREFRPFASRARLDFYDELPYAEILRRAAALPSGSAILYAQYTVGAEGVPHRDDSALTALHATAAAPVFGLFEHQLGKGIVGGPLVSAEAVGQHAASVAVRILQGEAPSRIRIPPIGPGVATFDWRELERWKIDPARLPSGSAIRFRPPSFWRRTGG